MGSMLHVVSVPPTFSEHPQREERAGGEEYFNITLWPNIWPFLQFGLWSCLRN